MADFPEEGQTQRWNRLGELIKKIGKDPEKVFDQLARDRTAINNALLDPFRFIEERIEKKKLDPFGEYAQKKHERAERVVRGEITQLEDNLLRFLEGFKIVEKEVISREDNILRTEARFKKDTELYEQNTAAAQQKITGLEARIKALGASTSLQQSAMQDSENEKQALRGHYARARLSTFASLFDAYARLNPAAGQSHDDEGGAAPSLNTEYQNFLKRCSEKLGKETKDAVIVWSGNADRGTIPVEESLQNIVLADTDKGDAFVHEEHLRLSSGIMQGYARIQRLQVEKITEHKAMAAQFTKEREKMNMQIKAVRGDKVQHYLRWRAERAELQREIAQLMDAGTQADDAYKNLDELYQGVFKEKEELATKYAQLDADLKKVAEAYGTLDVLLGISAKQAEDDKKHFTAQHASLEQQVAGKDKELERMREMYERRIAAGEKREQLAWAEAAKHIKSKEDELYAELIATHRYQEILTEREQELAGLRTQMESSEASRKAIFGQLARALAGKVKEHESGIAEHKKLQGVLLLKMKLNDVAAQHTYRLLEKAGILPPQQPSYEGLL